MAYSPIILWQIEGETMETVTDFILGAPKSLQMVIEAMKFKDTYSLDLIFLKMSDEYSKPPYKKQTGIPAGYTWHI